MAHITIPEAETFLDHGFARVSYGAGTKILREEFEAQLKD